MITKWTYEYELIMTPDRREFMRTVNALAARGYTAGTLQILPYNDCAPGYPEAKSTFAVMMVKSTIIEHNDDCEICNHPKSEHHYGAPGQGFTLHEYRGKAA